MKKTDGKCELRWKGNRKGSSEKGSPVTYGCVGKARLVSEITNPLRVYFENEWKPKCLEH